MGLVFANLPTEILLEIGNYLPPRVRSYIFLEKQPNLTREAELCRYQFLPHFSRVSKAARAAVLPILFSSLRMNLGEKDWANTAATIIQPTTLKYIEYLTLDIRLSYRTPRLDASVKELMKLKNNEGCAFLRSLSSLSTLRINVDINDMDRANCQASLRRPNWALVEALCKVPLGTATFELEFCNTWALDWNSDIWDSLVEPFRHYRKATVIIDECEYCATSDIAQIPMPDTFGSSWVQSLHLSAVPTQTLQMIAEFKNLTHLNVDLGYSSGRLIILCECLVELAPSLAFLAVSEVHDHLPEVLAFPPCLPRLEAVEVKFCAPMFAHRLLGNTQMTQLRNFEAILELRYVDAEDLIQLDQRLRKQNLQRHYNLLLTSRSSQWLEELDHLASYALQNPSFTDTIVIKLTGDIDIDIDDEEDHLEEDMEEEIEGNAHEDESAHQDSLALLETIPSVFMPALTALELSISNFKFMGLDNENILHFDHLAFISLTIENYVNDPDLHALRLLSGITTPGLETLHIRMIYESSVTSSEHVCSFLEPFIAK